MTDENNPFRVPQARVDDHVHTDLGSFLPDGRRVPVGQATRWLASGWQMFRVAAGTWIGMTAVLLLITVGLGVVPVVNWLLNLLFPVFVAGIVIGCRSLEEGNGLRLAHLFAGFSQRLGSLLAASVLYLLAILLAALLLGVLAAISGVGGMHGFAADFVVGMIVLCGVLVGVPLATALWLASPLIVFQQLSAYQALRAGFLVALRNVAPLLVYGLLALLAAALASLPFFLGWLVLIPILHASLYAFYRDVFFAK